MPSDYVLITGDKAIFKPAFGPATVAVMPGNLQGSASASCDMKKACIEGDEKKVMVAGCSYSQGSFQGGVGMLKIKSLGADQKAKKTKTDNKPLLLKGSTFIAEFKVMAPAMNPLGVPDPMASAGYIGSGQFVTANTKWKAE